MVKENVSKVLLGKAMEIKSILKKKIKIHCTNDIRIDKNSITSDNGTYVFSEATLVDDNNKKKNVLLFKQRIPFNESSLSGVHSKYFIINANELEKIELNRNISFENFVFSISFIIFDNTDIKFQTSKLINLK